MQGGQLRVIEGGRGGEEEGVRPGERDQVVAAACEGRALEEVLIAVLRRAVRLPVEPDLPDTARIGVQPFGLDPVVGEFEAVRVTDGGAGAEDQVDLEEGGLLGAGGVQLEGLPVRHPGVLGPVREGGAYRLPHGVERAEQVALAGSVRTEDPGHG